MKILILYESKKPQVTERMKKYAEFTYKKIDLKNFPTLKQPDGDIVIDYQYLFDFITNEDGVMAVVKGDKLRGVFGTYINYRGKHILQVEDNKGYRKWKQNRITRLWSLKLSRRRGDYPATQYTMEHELGHALCNHYRERDDLHAFVKFKRYDEWWDTKDFPNADPFEDSVEIQWGHGKSGAEIKPKCYILHTDMGSYEGTRQTIVESSSSVSYNLYVKKDGEVVEFVPVGVTAWHSGVVSNPTPEAAKFFGNKNPNSMSIGICFEGRGEDATPEQEEAIRKIISENGLMPIFAHKEITDYKPQAPLNLKRKLHNIENKEQLTFWLKLLRPFIK